MASGNYYDTTNRRRGGEEEEEEGRSSRFNEADNKEWSVQGGPEYNSGSKGGSYYTSAVPGKGGYGGGAQGGYNASEDEFGGALRHAQEHSGVKGDEAGGLFGSALGWLSGNKNEIASERVDEQWTIKAHDAMYGSRGGGEGVGGRHSSETVGAGQRCRRSSCLR